MESEWREVRKRRGGPPAKQTGTAGGSKITSFYISNLPGDANRKELWDLCGKLGNLTDIYIAGRRNFSGSFFAFIRFAEVMDPIPLSVVLTRKIAANQAKHAKPRPVKAPIKKKENTAPNTFRAATRGTRSFADVAKGIDQRVAETVIKLDTVQEIQTWVDRSVLVEEARNLDTLCNFATLMEMEGYNISEYKYGGGMQIVVKFKSERDADIFKANRGIWLKWFVRVDPLSKAEPFPGRITWFKIVGVPFTAWDEANMAAIAGKFGRVLVDVNSFWNCSDISSGKLYILTKKMTKINEEVQVSVNNKIQSVGVFEVEENWSPFSPFSHRSSEESEDEDDGEGSIPDSIEKNDDNLEEGEFIPTFSNQEAVPGAGKSVPPAMFNSQSAMADGKSHGKKDVVNTSPKVGADHTPRVNTCPMDLDEHPAGVGSEPNPVIDHEGAAPNQAQPGPFSEPNFACSQFNFNCGNSNSNSDAKVTQWRCKIKKSRQLNSFVPPARLVVNNTQNFDLNRSAPTTSESSSNLASSILGSSDSPTSSKDLEQTIEIGQSVGFQFDRRNAASLEALCGGGGAKTEGYATPIKGIGCIDLGKNIGLPFVVSRRRGYAIFLLNFAFGGILQI
ncbi:hypothetical protein LXL04_033714 [Taraxacum kok-saghyz]